MKHFGDVAKLSGYELPIVDVITGGSPCQDLSIAGKRAGLAGERSGLFMEQIRIIKEMRQHDRDNGRTDESVRPRYMVFENVCGLLSSNGGADFQAVLTEIVRIVCPEAPNVPLPKKWGGSGQLYDELGRFSIAWATHNSQYWGVPQRRRRICVVADFNGLTAGAVLFNPQYVRTSERGDFIETPRHSGDGFRQEVQSVGESVSGNTEQSESERQTIAGRTEESTAETSGTGRDSGYGDS